MTSARTTFASNEDRNAALIGGVTEEIKVLRQRGKKLFEQSLKVVILQDSLSTWKPKPGDLGVYGVLADDSPQHQLFVVLCNDIADLPPDIDGRCDFYMPEF
ncbi:hypothetical protein G7Z17_g7736 [Cylindrodendrum hubeiense]|uniref:Uncharacterized protein n=1 Tax=Cylindrodendrum hubeiense TaxID=595255 RepID=A0A9P5HAV7_9HYPO|nr:hypothetical protein G7Z17_g7736 [Cylindrodendrum hubeiense]